MAKYDWGDGKGKVHSIPLSQHRQNASVGFRTPWAPPPGTYDPNLDVQERAARTGYGQTVEDVGRSSEREQTDYGLGLGDVGRQYGQSLSDLLTTRQQAQENYGTDLQTLARNYQRLGNSQQGAARRMGQLEGGALAQGAQKRAANQAIDKTGIDTAFNRFMQASQLAEGRLGEAQGLQTGRLGLGHQRAQEDYGVTERRAGGGLSDYLQELAAARQSQYRQYTHLPLPRRGKKARA